MGDNRTFFACSVCQPGEDYCQENFKRIVSNNGFVLHRDTPQKGTYGDIEVGDILLLKYNNKFVAYGEVAEKKVTDAIDWSNWAMVRQWIFLNDVNNEEGISTYGIGFNTDGGGVYGTVKTLDESFGFDKIKGINSNSSLFKTIQNEILQKRHMEETTSIIGILKLKHQIILQGPPGTGKTRMAKQVARELLRPTTITELDILQSVRVDKELVTTSETAAFTVTKLLSDRMEYVRKSTGNSAHLTYKDVIEAYAGKIWLVKNGITSGSDTYSSTVAKFVYDNYESNQYKLIQFHPAYSYEDFVRGITVKTKDGQSEYITENKTLGLFAKEALGNYLDSLKDSASASKDIWLKNQFAEFTELVQTAIDSTEGKYILNDSVAIFEVEEDAFRYSGDWKLTNKHRMKFSDIVTMHQNAVSSHKDIRSLQNISGSAKQHPTYYYKLLQKFQEFLKTKPAFVQGNEKVPLKNYVLIIDEINRANLPSVLGELIYALEYRYDENSPQETTVESMYDIDGDRKLTLPPNLYIIGTMNTADRSVGHIDYAIRRRFAFKTIPSDESIISLSSAKEYFKEVKAIFEKHTASDFEMNDIMLGHSYFLAKDEDELKLKLKYEVVPILREYLKDGVLNKNEESIKAVNDFENKIPS